MNQHKLSHEKILLVMDGYRSNMRYNTLNILKSANVITYTLPTHTSGVTQPRDLSVYKAFKIKLSDLVDGLLIAGGANVYDQFDFLELLIAAYRNLFTRSNIASRSSNVGIYPANLSYVILVFS